MVKADTKPTKWDEVNQQSQINNRQKLAESPRWAKVLADN